MARIYGWHFISAQTVVLMLRSSLMKSKSGVVSVARMSTGRKYLPALSGALQPVSAWEKRNGSSLRLLSNNNPCETTRGLAGLDFG